ncbi:hypothetical protein FIBSPDRAFT_878517 [Athelia psychrophila]|uniref:Uncharacterized protein n=1 Tax=Athelia psychrophila TaxID=1759441 RepID=A0A167UY99_9AGAM|nr:hypothetical protein FIBSPDRAFT_878504 [Fibularhizoctonia sp. CBS 109695]KZP04446.1 hypothetical protein FIBSPDRAFT_878517 [Fibularhizoctonia sp. CBS 109695]
MPKHNFVSGYVSHDAWYARYAGARQTQQRIGSNPPEWLVDQGKAIAERERLDAAKAAAEAQLHVDRAGESESEFYLRMVQRDAAVRAEMRAGGMKLPPKETHKDWYARVRRWIQEKEGMSTMEYPEWISEEGRLVALRENIEDQLRASGEYE